MMLLQVRLRQQMALAAICGLITTLMMWFWIAEK